MTRTLWPLPRANFKLPAATKFLARGVWSTRKGVAQVSTNFFVSIDIEVSPKFLLCWVQGLKVNWSRMTEHYPFWINCGLLLTASCWPDLISFKFAANGKKNLPEGSLYRKLQCLRAEYLKIELIIYSKCWAWLVINHGQTKEQLKVWKMGGLVLGTSICSKSNYRSWSFLVQNRSKSFTFEIETNTKLSLRETQIRISKIACFIFKNDTLNG